MFLIDAIKPTVGKKFNTFFTRVFRGGKIGEYKINPVLSRFVLGLLATIYKNKIQKKREKKIVLFIIEIPKENVEGLRLSIF